MNWNDIKVHQWYELQKVGELYPDELDQRLAIVGICFGLTFEEMQEVKITDINRMVKELDFLDTPMKNKIVSKWKDIKFVVKLSDLKAGQMIHFLDVCGRKPIGLTPDDIIWKDTGSTLETSLHTILAVLDTTYPKNFAEVEKLILNECPITIVKGLSDFFFRKYSLLPQTIQEYSRSQLKEMETDLKNYNQSYLDSLNNGNGSPPLNRSQKQPVLMSKL